MLLEGNLQSWNDERGFGFIAPDGGGPQVFVHISAFQNTAARPQAGQRLSYVLDKPAGDRPRASRARVLGAAVPPSTHPARPRAATTRARRQVTSAARSGASGGAALLFIPALAALLLVLGLSFGPPGGLQAGICWPRLSPLPGMPGTRLPRGKGIGAPPRSTCGCWVCSAAGRAPCSPSAGCATNPASRNFCRCSG